MVEVRTLTVDVEGPPGEGWVLLEKRGDQYFISWRQNGKALETFVVPGGVDTPEAAIRAATGWADLLEIPLLYVRDNPQTVIKIRLGPRRRP
jgi:hypothetical protein